MIRSDRIRTLHAAIQTLRMLQEQTRVLIGRLLELPGAGDLPWRNALSELEARLAGHVRALDEVLLRLEVEPSGLRDAAGAFAGTLAAWLEAARSDEPLSHRLRDVLGALTLARIEARMLRVVAAAFRDDATAEIAEAQAATLADRIPALEVALDQGLREELEAEGKARPGTRDAAAGLEHPDS